MVPSIEFTNALAAEISAARDALAIARRYIIYFEAKEVENGVWFMLVSAETITQKRLSQSSTFETKLVYQRALPPSSAEYPDPTNNIPFLDECSAEVERTKELFREDGELVAKPIWGASFQGLSNDPLYIAPMMLDHGIFTSSITFNYFL